MTWSWETCRSPSPSGTGRTPGADSGGKKGGAPIQDSPANPWDCGLARARSRHRSWRVNKKTKAAASHPMREIGRAGPRST